MRRLAWLLLLAPALAQGQTPDDYAWWWSPHKSTAALSLPLTQSGCYATGDQVGAGRPALLTVVRPGSQTALDLSLTCPADTLLIGVNGAEVLPSPATRPTVPVPAMSARWCWAGTVLIIGGAGGTANNVTFAVGDDGNGWRMVTGVVPFSDGAAHRVSVCANAGVLAIRDGTTVISGATTGTGTGYWTPQPGQYAGIASDKGNMQLGGALKDWKLYLNQTYRTGM